MNFDCIQSHKVVNFSRLSSNQSNISQHLQLHSSVVSLPIISVASSFDSPIIPLMMSLNITLPNFSGKAKKMPMNFITEFELRAISLFGSPDAYLLRIVPLALSATALTWYIQRHADTPVTSWIMFKELFLRRFRTPQKIKSFRSRLHLLWQGDNELTIDYFDRLRDLIFEIEPSDSTDYLKRKFLQKLRNDIRDKFPLGITFTLSELVQKAIQIETNVVRYKDDT